MEQGYQKRVLAMASAKAKEVGKAGDLDSLVAAIKVSEGREGAVAFLVEEHVSARLREEWLFRRRGLFRSVFRRVPCVPSRQVVPRLRSDFSIVWRGCLCATRERMHRVGGSVVTAGKGEAQNVVGGGNETAGR